MAMINYEIAKERRNFCHRVMTRDSVLSDATDSRLNSKSQQHDDKKVSSNYKQTTRLTHRADNDFEVVERVIISESNEKSDYSNNEDTDRSEQIMVPSGEYLIGAEIMTNCILNFVYQCANKPRNTTRWLRIRLSDPSEWNSSHIASWISWCSRTFSIKPIAALLLPSTGKELLKLSLRDWQNIGGLESRILARHLGYLHLQATGVHTPDLLQEDDDSTGELDINSKFNYFSSFSTL